MSNKGIYSKANGHGTLILIRISCLCSSQGCSVENVCLRVSFIPSTCNIGTTDKSGVSMMAEFLLDNLEQDRWIRMKHPPSPAIMPDHQFFLWSFDTAAYLFGYDCQYENATPPNSTGRISNQGLLKRKLWWRRWWILDWLMKMFVDFSSRPLMIGWAGWTDSRCCVPSQPPWKDLVSECHDEAIFSNDSNIIHAWFAVNIR